MSRRYILAKQLSALAAAVFVVMPGFALAADLSFSPSNGTYTVGQTFTVQVMVSPGVDSVNAADGTITYDTHLISIDSFTKDGSVFSLWTSDPTLDNAAGTLTFSGGTPTAFSSDGPILTLKVRALQVGTATMSFSNASVLAADGKGTNVFGTSTPAAFTIAAAPQAPAGTTASTTSPADQSAGTGSIVNTGPPPTAPVIDSPTFPKEDQWYATSTGVFTWTPSPDITGVRILLSASGSSTPTQVLKGVATSSLQTGILDGVSYFYVQYQNDSGWGDIAKRKVQIDTAPPKPFDITLNTGGANGPTLAFKAQDDLSGIDHYQLLLGSTSIAAIQAKDMPDGTYPVPPQNGGSQAVTVRAYDLAGNMTEETKTLMLPKVDKPANNTSSAPAGNSGGSGFYSILAILFACIIGALLMWIRMIRRNTDQNQLALLKQIAESNDKNDRVFSAMREEFEQMINDFDPKPQLTPEERKLLEDIREVIDLSEELISSGMDDLKKMVRGGS